MIDKLYTENHDVSFFQAVYLLEKKYYAERGESFNGVGSGMYPKDEPIEFAISPELGFPRSDIKSITKTEREGAEYTRVEVNFSGLHGTNSPLPSSYTEKLAGRDDEDNPVRHFFDFFHNRYLSFFYRIWKKYRYHTLYESGATDHLSSHLFNFVGLSSDIQASESSHLDRAKLLSYVGQLSTRTRSPKLVSGIVAHCFGLENVSIEEWVLRRVVIEPTQRNMLGRVNCTLGEDYHAGGSILDVTGKFNLCFKQLDFEQYVDFLPGRVGYNVLKELMRFILRDPMAWDLKLEVNSESLPTNILGGSKGNTLGQTLWLGNHQGHNEEIIIIGET